MPTAQQGHQGAARLDVAEAAILARSEGPEVPIKDLELRLEDRGFSDIQTRRALMSLLRRGHVCLAGAKRVTWKGAERPH